MPTSLPSPLPLYCHGYLCNNLILPLPSFTGACFFDIDQVADQKTSLPHMLPSAETFASACGDLGLARDDEIVVYNSEGAFSAARCWWTFKCFGE